MKIVNVVRYLDENLGDHYSTPFKYFSFLGEAERLDPHTGNFAPLLDPSISPDIIIVGGGGQIANSAPAYDKNLATVAESPGAAIAWGIGHNTHYSTSIKYPAYLEEYKLVGLRDWGSPYEWVPDASCFLSGLDGPHEPTRPVVLYEHWQIPSGVNGVPSMRNSAKEVDNVLQFLSSAEVVVTNTFHGWYWATLMGRRVVLIEPFSTKFSGLRYKPIVASRQTWQRAALDAVAYPDALAECRDANLRFAAKVAKLYGLDGAAG